MREVILGKKTIAAELGRQGENGAVEVRFAIPGDWQSAAAEYTIRAVRPGENEAYVPEGLAVSEGVISWVPNSADTALAGAGEMQVCCVSGGKIIKSRTYKTHISPSVGVDNEVVPAPEQSILSAYLEMISAFAEGAGESSTAAEASSQAAQSSASSAAALKQQIESQLALLSAQIREQVLAAVAEAVETGTITDLDTGFVTMLKEQNKGLGFKVWLGTVAEYELLEENELLEPSTLYIRTDDTSAAEVRAVAEKIAFLGQIDTTKTLAEIFADHRNGITVYHVAGNSGTSIYPVEVSAGSQASAYGVVTLISSNGAGIFRFDYAGDSYTAYVCDTAGAVSVGDWVRLTPSDTGWLTLTISGTGFTAGSPTPQYRKIGNRVIGKGQIAVDMDNVSDVTTVFATLPSGYRPATALYRLIPGEGDRQARLYVSSSGGVNINYFKTYAGDTVTGSHWVQLDCEFLTD